MRSLDPSSLIAAHLHTKVCPGHETAVEPADCLLMGDSVAAFRSELAGAGLAVVPLAAVQLLERLYADATDEATPIEEVASTMSGSEARAREQVWLSVAYVDGERRREGPYQRWQAEILLGDLNFTHDEAMVSARIEPEAAWIADLLADFGTGPDDASL